MSSDATLLDPVRPGFDEVRVGQTSVADPVPVTHLLADDDLRTFHHLLSDLRPCSGAVVIAADWTRLSTLEVGRVLSARGTVTRWRVGREAGTGVVHQDVNVVDADGQPVQRGLVRWRAPRDGDGDGQTEDRIVLDFGSLAWAKRLAARLATVEFSNATATFDGSIGLRADGEEVCLRIYRGQIIEVATKVIGAPTFTVEGAALSWVELITGPVNDYVRRTVAGQFKVHGNSFEYLRLTKALMLLVNGARALYAGGVGDGQG